MMKDQSTEVERTRPYRLKTTDLCMADAMPFQQHHEARVVGVDLNDKSILSDEFFTNVQSNLKPGDQVVVCNYLDSEHKRLVQFVALRIVAKGANRVTFIQMSEIVTIPLTDNEPAPKEPSMRLVVRRTPNGFAVLDERENLLEAFATKKEAETWAREMRK